MRIRELVRTALDRSLLLPIRGLRREYLPLLMIYFAYGATRITGIAETFYVRESLSMEAEDLAALSVWTTVPWTVKMVFGQLVDAVPILGSRRRVYVFLGAALITLGYVLLAASAGHFLPGSPNALYVASQIITVCGLVMQDVVADTMSTEVVRRHEPDGSPRDGAAIESDLGLVQLLGRLALSFGMLLTAWLGGELAATLPRATVFWCGLVVPLLSVLGAIFVKVDASEPGKLDPRILTGGVAFGAFSVAMGLLQRPYGQEIVFAVSLVVVLSLLWVTVRDLPRATLTSIGLASLVIFTYRGMPNVGPAGTWWQIDVLHFDERFFGRLELIGGLLAIAGMWFGSGAVTRRPIGWVLAVLTLVGFVVSLPTIGMFYGLHEWTEEHWGFGARTIALVDTSVGSPFAQLSMIPMLTLVAVHAPAGRRATWFALMASLMNLALNAGNLSTKYLNGVFQVQRNDYDSLGELMIVVNLIGLVVPLVVIALTGRRLRESAEKAAALSAESSVPSEGERA